MNYNFTTLKKGLSDAEEWFKREAQNIRTGRANPSILDSVQVSSYGSKMPINQLANISVEDARTIRITPWDSTVVKEMEKAIVDSGLGLSVSVDDKGIRIFFPELTTERRGEYVKLAKTKLEDARISIRKERDNTWNDIQKMEKDGMMNEDEKFRSKTEMQKFVDDCNKNLEVILEKKEKEIMG